MPKDFKLTPLSALLRLHSLAELKSLYKKLNDKELKDSLSHTELVKLLSASLTFDKLFDEWANKIYAHNTTIRIYEYLNADGSPYTNSGKYLEARFGERQWDRLTGQGMSPEEIPAEGQLIHVGEIEDRLYMLFVLPGRAKEVLEGLVLRQIPQTAFLLAVLNTKDGILQVRGQEPRGFAATRVASYFREGKGPQAISSAKKIGDLAGANALKQALDGKLHRGRFSHETEEIADITMASQRDVELSRTRKYRELIDQGYDLNSIGIDFRYNRKEFTLWVGLTIGTYWFRSGDVTEEVLQYVERKILSL